MLTSTDQSRENKGTKHRYFIGLRSLIFVSVLLSLTVGYAVNGEAFEAESVPCRVSEQAEQIRELLPLSYRITREPFYSERMQGMINYLPILCPKSVSDRESDDSPTVQVQVPSSPSSTSETARETPSAPSISETPSAPITETARETPSQGAQADSTAGETETASLPTVPSIEPEASVKYPVISLSVPVYRQYDERWGNLTLGESGESVRKIGCTLTCLAMAESYRTGQTVTPASLVNELSFTEDGALFWPYSYHSVAFDGGDYLTFLYLGLRQGIPVILHTQTDSGESHWVIVVGFSGGNTLTTQGFSVHDPATVSRTRLAQVTAKYPKLIKAVLYLR